MPKKIIYLIILLSLFVVSNVYADNINCDYDESSVRISYNNGNVVYDLESINKWYQFESIYRQASALWDSGKLLKYTDENIKIINQDEWKEQLDKNVCPQTIYLCEEAVWGIEHPNLYGVGSSGMDLLERLGGLFGDNYDAIYKDQLWSLFVLDKKQLDIVTEKTYQEKYSANSWKINFVVSDNAIEGADYCEWGGGFGDAVCGIVWGIVGTVVDTAYNPSDQLLLGVTTYHCDKIIYPEDGPYTPINAVCPQIQFHSELLDKYINQYKSCNEKDNLCKIEKKQSINSVVDNLRISCDSALKYYSYVGDQKECINFCLSLNKKLGEINKLTKQAECGFSGKLIQFIANIVKWVKYIIPVIVIVLGILDFIKAIAADKDDEMKKAQGRFVKRLIAAALIFIMPFIIEFVLDKMGFAANGCGIIDL